MFSIKVTMFLVAIIGFAGAQPAAAQADSLFKGAMLERLHNAKAYTMAVAAALPDSLYSFAPVPGTMTFAQQLQHMAQNLEMLCEKYLGWEKEAWPLDLPDPMPKQVRERVAGAFDIAIHTVKNTPSDSLGVVVPFFAGPKTRLQIIQLLNDHQSHHRGELIVYLRLCGMVPPRYVGW